MLNPSRLLAWARQRFDIARGIYPAPPIPTGALNEYVESMPSAQNAIDAVPGWNHALPPEMGVNAGRAHLYYDPRILWCIEQLNGVAGRTVLELGPLEGSHSFILDRHEVAVIHAIEANKTSFLRCLVAKEVLDMPRAKFFLGNFVLWLERPGARYDLAIASGVLYHMRDPVRLLELLGGCTDNIYLWTHYFDPATMPVGDTRRLAFDDEHVTADFRGIPIRLYGRTYNWSWVDKRFCGGMYDRHFWLERDQIVAILRALGFDDIRIAHDEPDHVGGPSCSIFARRSQPTPIAEATPTAA